MAETTVKNAKAVKHTAEMQRRFADKIRASFRTTEVYTGQFGRAKQASTQPLIEVVDTDTVSAILKTVSDNKNKNKRIAALNFASYKNPGGGFIRGSYAQEEALCHESNLYNVLRLFEETFYETNRENLNRGLYTDRGLYSTDIVFERDNQIVECDIITVAAPNRGAARRYNKASEEENEIALKRRITFLLDMAEEHEVKVLILGAFGCGVFKQDPQTVARIFKQELIDRSFEEVIFAIPNGKNNNLQEFRTVFNQ